MIRLLLFALLIHTISAKCNKDDKKEKLDVQVIELDDSSSDSSKDSSNDSDDDSNGIEVVTLTLSNRRKREVEINNQGRRKRNYCKNDDDCGSGLVCLAHLTCVKGTRRSVDSLEASAAD